MKLLSWALAGHACYNIPSLAIPDRDLRTIRSKVKTPGDMAAASPACRLVSLMPFRSDRSEPGPVNSPDPGASRQARLSFYAGGSPRQPPTTMSTSKCDKHTRRVYLREPMCQQRALSPRPKGRGTPRFFGRAAQDVFCARIDRRHSSATLLLVAGKFVGEAVPTLKRQARKGALPPRPKAGACARGSR
jgi:hypothetical protein